jgi:itaconate CoA-transferase
MLDATVEWMGYSLYTQLHTGRQPPRTGVGHPSIAPYDSYPTRDGQVLIGVQSDPGWRDLVTQVLDAPELADDIRYATNVARVRHRAECDEEVARRTATWTSDQLVERLTRAGVPAARIKQMADVVDHPQLRARDRWRPVNTEFARIEALLPPVSFAGTETPMGDVPALGQHTRELLREVGLSDAEAQEALACGAAVQGPAPHRSLPWEDAS